MVDYISGALHAICHPAFHRAISVAQAHKAYGKYISDIKTATSNLKEDHNNYIFTGYLQGKTIEQFNISKIESYNQKLALIDDRKKFLKYSIIVFLVAALVCTHFVPFLSIGLVAAISAILIIHCHLTFTGNKIESELAIQGVLLAQQMIHCMCNDMISLKYRTFHDSYVLGLPSSTYLDSWDIPYCAEPENEAWQKIYHDNFETTLAKLKEKMPSVIIDWYAAYDDVEDTILGLFKKDTSKPLVEKLAKQLYECYRSTINNAMEAAKNAVPHQPPAMG